MRPLALALILLVPVLVASPGAVAQAEVVDTQVQVTIEDPGRALVPGRNETIPARINYVWNMGARPAFDPSGPNNTQVTRITLSVVQQPSWVIEAHVYPSELLIDFPSAFAPINGQRFIDVSVNLTLDPLAPALQREDILVQAVAEPNGNMKGATGQNSGMKLRANVIGLLNVTPPETIVVLPGGRWTSVPFTVTNEGNSDIVARLTLVGKPQNSEARVPTEVAIKRGESAVVDVEVRLPWTEGQAGTLELSATPLLPNDDGRAAVGIANVQGTSAVPGVGLVPLLLVLVVLALRRRL